MLQMICDYIKDSGRICDDETRLRTKRLQESVQMHLARLDMVWPPDTLTDFELEVWYWNFNGWCPLDYRKRPGIPKSVWRKHWENVVFPVAIMDRRRRKSDPTDLLARSQARSAGVSRLVSSAPSRTPRQRPDRSNGMGDWLAKAIRDEVRRSFAGRNQPG